MSPSNKTWHIIPPEEARCVWMAAGIISYQLCNRRFDCENCALDAAIRNHGGPRKQTRYERNVQSKPAANPEGLPDDRLYSGNHCWTLLVEDQTTVRIGIEPGLGEALIAPKAVVLPTPGQHVRDGQTCVWVVMDGGTLPLSCPVSGVVTKTNPKLAKQPLLLSSHSLDEGWLCELETTLRTEPAQLMDKNQASAKYRMDQDKFISLLQKATAGGCHPVGITLADGGQRLQSAADMIGAGRYFALLRKVFA